MHVDIRVCRTRTLTRSLGVFSTATRLCAHNLTTAGARSVLVFGVAQARWCSSLPIVLAYSGDLRRVARSSLIASASVSLRSIAGSLLCELVRDKQALCAVSGWIGARLAELDDRAASVRPARVVVVFCVVIRVGRLASQCADTRLLDHPGDSCDLQPRRRLGAHRPPLCADFRRPLNEAERARLLADELVPPALRDVAASAAASPTLSTLPSTGFAANHLAAPQLVVALADVVVDCASSLSAALRVVVVHHVVVVGFSAAHDVVAVVCAGGAQSLLHRRHSRRAASPSFARTPHLALRRRSIYPLSIVAGNVVVGGRQSTARRRTQRLCRYRLFAFSLSSSH